MYAKVDPGSLVTVLLDLEEGSLSFCINAKSHGVAYTLEPLKIDQIYFCVTLETKDDSIELVHLPDLSFADEKLQLTARVKDLEIENGELADKSDKLSKSKTELKTKLAEDT